ncbi:anti-sigma factor domain-containing protein [Aquabacterium sp. J223]|uniref:anti-sigma factor n=1 Tax=Aquabacterium sp. J223 TaxID=2898431 RepID=UPI0021ADF2AB|nr:anti-sigma factor [Aquabacterium sp. J223]UUX96054.1 anti-sigma factor [Aquabacterium sp. J223]
MDYARPELIEALASQYVAGTLRGRARRRFESLLQAHPALRQAVSRWNDWLMPLTVALPPVEPSDAVWDGIERRLWPKAVVAPPPWWQRLTLWRGVSAVAGLAVLVLAGLLARPQETQAPIVVVLQGTGTAAASPAFVASLSADGRALVTRPVQPVAMPQDQVLELWSVPAQGAPRSLGLISPQGLTVVPRRLLGDAVAKGETAALAVTVEPPGGAASPQAHGPIVYLGKLQL